MGRASHARAHSACWSDLGPQGVRFGIQYCAAAADGVVNCGPYPGDGGAGDVLKEPRSDLLQEVRLVAGWGEWGGQKGKHPVSWMGLTPLSLREQRPGSFRLDGCCHWEPRPGAPKVSF